MNVELREEIKNKYNEILDKYNFNQGIDVVEINLEIKKAINSFLRDCRCPAIWCNGQHTKMLMADFVFELKNVEYIIDEGYRVKKNDGLCIIGIEDIKSKNIDGIIISSYKYRKEIIDIIKRDFSHLKVLDIYLYLEQRGIFLETEYYNGRHPYNLLHNLNRYIRNYEKNPNTDDARQIERLLLKIKDFQLAEKWADRFLKELGDEWKEIYQDISSLYQIQLDSVKKIAASNVLMLCFDGLRQKDLENGCMPNLKQYFDNNTCYFTNAYSVSTSTFESLIPAYGSYMDFTYEYYKDNVVKEGDCEFINKAIEQKRDIFFYTDSIRFVEESVKVTNYSQLATQKIWDFILDALGTDNGLFYLHILYETHYSYPNPYTENHIIADGSNICFDFMPQNGGKLRTDYEKQHDDALRYIDDIVGVFLNKLRIGIVFFADHGNVLYPVETMLKDTRYTDYTFGQDLIRIPIAIKYDSDFSDALTVGVDNKLISLFSINEIVVALLNRKLFRPNNKEYVKIQRSQLYNPNFRYLMKKLNYEKGLDSFEGYIFEDGNKLIIYGNDSKELYNLFDERIDDETLIDKKVSCINNN